MKARQHLQRLPLLTLVLLAPAFFSIVSIPIVSCSGDGLIGSPAQAAGETPQDMLAAGGPLNGADFKEAL
jgi:hypothetical protein